MASRQRFRSHHVQSQIYPSPYRSYKRLFRIIAVSIAVWLSIASQLTLTTNAQEATPTPTPPEEPIPWEIPALRKLYGSLQPAQEQGSSNSLQTFSAPVQSSRSGTIIDPGGDVMPLPITADETATPTATATATATATPTPTPEHRRFTPVEPLDQPPQHTGVWDVAEPYRFIEETGHNLKPAIKTFYDANGGMAVFGWPLTELLDDTETGLQVQYFERARIELHADRPITSQIELTNIGTQMHGERTGQAFTPLRHPPKQDSAFFTKTGYRVSGKFRSFWDEHGGVRTFGYPISREMVEDIDGQQRPVQYFERARLEYHAEHIDTPNVIQVGLLGTELAKHHEIPPSLLAPAEPIVKLSSSTTTFLDSAGTRNATIAAERLNGAVIGPGETLSFLDSIGELSERTGYTTGTAIVNNQIVPIVAGGICQTSTTLYRAGFDAGLDITERHAHSLYIAAFNDILSLDAAVYSPGLDLRITNDTMHPILVTAMGENGQITVEFWGRDDGRTTQMLEPQIRSVIPSGPAIWRYDEELEPDAIEQETAPRDGMDIVVQRIVQTEDGDVIHQDSFVTLYNPVTEVVRYGAEVVPPEDVQIEGDLPPTPTPTPEGEDSEETADEAAPDNAEDTPSTVAPPADVQPTTDELPEASQTPEASAGETPTEAAPPEPTPEAAPPEDSPPEPTPEAAPPEPTPAEEQPPAEESTPAEDSSEETGVPEEAPADSAPALPPDVTPATKGTSQ